MFDCSIFSDCQHIIKDEELTLLSGPGTTMSNFHATLTYENDKNILQIREFNKTEGLTDFSWYRDGFINFTLQPDFKTLVFNTFPYLPFANGSTFLYPQELYLATYTTPKVSQSGRTCPNCYGTGILRDISFDRLGDLVLVDKKERVSQLIGKALLTEKGSNIFHSEFGSLLSSMGGKKITPFFIAQLQQSIQSCINQLMNYQASYIGSLTPQEVILGIDSIKVNQDPKEPRIIELKITVLLGDQTTTQASFKLSI
jgi:phage baseplate assembly protein W